MRAKLILVAGKADKAEVRLNLPTLVGRGSDAGLMIAHKTVSRRHCEILERHGGLIVRDSGSLNGTLIDGQPIKEAPLRPGQTLTVGPLTFRAEYEPADEIIHGDAPDAADGNAATVIGNLATSDAALAALIDDEPPSGRDVGKPRAEEPEALDKPHPAAATVTFTPSADTPTGNLDVGDVELPALDDDLPLPVEPDVDVTIDLPVTATGEEPAVAELSADLPAGDDDLALTFDLDDAGPAAEPAAPADALPLAAEPQADLDLDASEISLDDADLTFDLVDDAPAGGAGPAAPNSAAPAAASAAPAGEPELSFDDDLSFDLEDVGSAEVAFEVEAAPSAPAAGGLKNGSSSDIAVEAQQKENKAGKKSAEPQKPAPRVTDAPQPAPGAKEGLSAILKDLGL